MGRRRSLLKKSQVDYIALFFAVTIIFAFAVFMLILFNAYNDNIKDNLSDALTSSTPQDSSANVTKILNDAGGGISMFNNLFPFLLIGIIGYVAITALMFKSHPAFFFIGLIVLGVAIILAVTFSNVYEAIGDKPAFANADAEFTISGFILSNLPIFTLIIFVIIAIVLFGIPKASVGGNY